MFEEIIDLYTLSRIFNNFRNIETVNCMGERTLFRKQKINYEQKILNSW